MINVQEKFKIDIDKLPSMSVMVLKATLKTGREHLKNFQTTMSAFKFPEKRLKCHDTIYYETVVPIIENILVEYEKLKK